MTEKGIILIRWYGADNDGNYRQSLDDVDEYMADIDKGIICDEDVDDNLYPDEPYYYSASPIGEVMSRFVEEDGSFLTDELTEKFVIEAIRRATTEETLPSGIFRIQPWKKPHYGEFILVYEINSIQSNHPLDPIEWDLEINCIGVLDGNIKMVEI